MFVVIPCYNETERLDVSSFHIALKKYQEVFFCFVNDGSTDRTKVFLEEHFASLDRCTIINLEKNQGKAEAVRSGTLYGLSNHRDAAYFGFLDADLSTPIDEIMKMGKCISERPDVQMIFGLRLKRYGANVQRLVRRHISGRIFATVANWILGIEIYDSQCGAKLFRQEIANELFAEPFVSRWFFDLEIIIRFRKVFPKSPLDQAICEYPLHTWIEMGNSKITWKDFFLAPFEILKIKRKYK